MHLRTYQPPDAPILYRLFYDTVHSVNRADYTSEQADAWAPLQTPPDSWSDSLQAHYTLVAEAGGHIVGFGDITPDGYLDRLYVHPYWQRKGVASLLCDALEQHCDMRPLITYASITAKPFFEKRGYHVACQNQVERKGQTLLRYKMEKL